MSRFTFVDNESGDWTGFYIDGKLAIENHSLRAEEVLDLALEALGQGPSDGRYLDGDADEWLQDIGNLPETLAELDAKIAGMRERQK